MRHGTVMSLRGTASGLLFAAHLAPEQVLDALAAETGTARAHRIDADLARQLDEVRAQGLSRAVDALLPGVSAMAAPVFDERGAIALSLTAIGPSAVFDTRFDGAVATALRTAAEGLSRQLGARA
jgi:DNA-binding IclR family transcriptional regulator